jgi:toxin-antitoxin system PIN domain toxin
VKILDANVLIAAAASDHAHHAVATRWLGLARRESEALALCPVVALAFLRITTHPKIQETPLTAAQALAWLQTLLRSPSVRWMHPANEHLMNLQRLLTEPVVGNLVMDAHIAALALENGASVVTFDRDFLRFPGLRVELLTHETN